MKVLSLFDGCSMAQQSLKELGYANVEYYASEVDKYAIQITQKNFPNTIQLGDINTAEIPDIEFDLIIGGSPCQDLSIANKNKKGLEGEKSRLFYKFFDILQTKKHKYFILENVASMTNKNRDIISEVIGVQPIMINSALLSAQQRKRYYWTNIKGIIQPDDKKIFLKDILQNGFVDRDKSYCIDANYFKGSNLKQYLIKKRRQLVFNIFGDNDFDSVSEPIRVDKIGKGSQGRRIYCSSGKSVNLDTKDGEYYLTVNEATKKGYCEILPGECVDLGNLNSKTRRGRAMKEKSNCLTTTNNFYKNIDSFTIRKLTPIECERLQCLPDDYTDGVSNAQRYKMIGNGFTVSVIKHILKNIKE